MALKVARFAFALVVLASCGASDQPARQTNRRAAVEQAARVKLGFESSAFKNGEPIPAQYTCDGADETPALGWSEPPKGTRSFALVIEDPDAPSGTFHHWGVFDIEPSARSIGGDQKIGSEVINDFNRRGYGGPCPPRGQGPHHYHFKLLGLEVDHLGLSSTAKVADLERAAEMHAIAYDELIGTSERK